MDSLSCYAFLIIRSIILSVYACELLYVSLGSYTVLPPLTVYLYEDDVPVFVTVV
jgi:hypothetical protein